MRIGVMFDTEQPFDEMVGQVASLRDEGIEVAWSSQIFGYDALTALAAFGPRGGRHPSRNGGGAYLSPSPGDAGRPSPHRAGGHRRAPDPGDRPLPPDRDRERLRHVVRASRAPHARVPVHPHAPARRRAGELYRRDTAGVHHGPAADHGAGARRAGGGPRARHARHRRPHGCRHHHLDVWAGHHRVARRSHHPAGGQRRRPARSRRWPSASRCA